MVPSQMQVISFSVMNDSRKVNPNLLSIFVTCEAFRDLYLTQSLAHIYDFTTGGDLPQRYYHDCSGKMSQVTP